MPVRILILALTRAIGRGLASAVCDSKRQGVRHVGPEYGGPGNLSTDGTFISIGTRSLRWLFRSRTPLRSFASTSWEPTSASWCGPRVDALGADAEESAAVVDRFLKARVEALAKAFERRLRDRIAFYAPWVSDLALPAIAFFSAAPMLRSS